MRGGAKREFFKNQFLILQRHSRRHLFFLGGCQEQFLPHDIHHSSFTGYSLHTTVCCSMTLAFSLKVYLLRFPAPRGLFDWGWGGENPSHFRLVRRYWIGFRTNTAALLGPESQLPPSVVLLKRTTQQRPRPTPSHGLSKSSRRRVCRHRQSPSTPR